MKIVMTGNVYPVSKNMAYGGERILFYLVEELVKLGHDVYCFMREGSNFEGVAIKEYIPVPALDGKIDVHYEAVKKYIDKTGIDFDIYFCGYFGDGWDQEILNRFNYIELCWCMWCHIGHQLKQSPFNTISYSKVMQNDFRNIGMDTTLLYYGIPKDLYKFQPKHDDYAVWIGKIEGGKYPEAAIKLAKAAGLKIVIMAPPYNTGCFWQQVAPYIDNETVFWVRGVDDYQKYKIMSRAKVFIMSNDNSWREHFGIVNIEALAMGVPVLGFNRINHNSAIKEDKIIRDGIDGFLLEYTDSNDLNYILDIGVPLLNKIDQIDRAKCRQQFESMWTSELMAKRYTWMFDKIKDGDRFPNIAIPF